MSKKSFCLETSVLIENPKCIEILRNGDENDIYIASEVINEIDGLKKNSKVSHIVREVVDELLKFQDYITIIGSITDYKKNDNRILDEVNEYVKLNSSKIIMPFIFVTNDKLLALKARKLNIETQDFKQSNPYKSESEQYTGFINLQDPMIYNSFTWNEGKLHYNISEKENKLLNYQNNIWTLEPKTPYQNAAFELLLNPDIDLITIQSSAGFGKSLISLASALYWTQQLKKFKKIFVFKHHVDVGDEKLGYLPGSIDEKVEPYIRSIYDLIIKLHEKRPCNKLFIDPKSKELELNKRFIEFLPLNYIRGMNIDNSYVIIDEAQNLSRENVRTILSRMGENVRVVCTGDVDQIDCQYLNKSNNGMNWICSKMKNRKNYAHIVLKGKNSRGPIADMVRESGL